MGRRGIVYVVSLGLAVLLSVFGATLLLRSVSELGQSTRFTIQTAALHHAEAAVDQAIRNLRNGTSSNISTTTLPGGTYWAELAPLGTQMQRITAHGSAGSDQRNLDVIIKLTPESVFQYALFGDQKIVVSGSADTDSYDSRLPGGYSSQTAGGNGGAGTNATSSGGVTVSGSVGINGQVVVGPTGNPNSVVTITGGGGITITGNPKIVAQSQALPLASVKVPEELTCNDYTVSDDTTITLSSDQGTYCFRNLTVSGGGTLTADGPVTVYLTGELRASGNTLIGVVNNPRTMLFLVAAAAGTTLGTTGGGSITGNSTFYGALYGPGAEFDVTGSAEIFGSVIAKRVDLSGSAKIHYDEALTTLPVGSTYQTSIVLWREI